MDTKPSETFTNLAKAQLAHLAFIDKPITSHSSSERGLKYHSPVAGRVLLTRFIFTQSLSRHGHRPRPPNSSIINGENGEIYGPTITKS